MSITSGGGPGINLRVTFLLRFIFNRYPQKTPWLATLLYYGDSVRYVLSSVKFSLECFRWNMFSLECLQFQWNADFPAAVFREIALSKQVARALAANTRKTNASRLPTDARREKPCVERWGLCILPTSGDCDRSSLNGGQQPMAEKVAKAGVKRAEGFLYYIDKQGDVSRAKMARGGKKGGKPEKVLKLGIKKESGYLYYLDKKGDVSRAKMVNA